MYVYGPLISWELAWLFTMGLDVLDVWYISNGCSECVWVAVLLFFKYQKLHNCTTCGVIILVENL